MKQLVSSQTFSRSWELCFDKINREKFGNLNPYHSYLQGFSMQAMHNRKWSTSMVLGLHLGQIHFGMALAWALVIPIQLAWNHISQLSHCIMNLENKRRKIKAKGEIIIRTGKKNPPTSLIQSNKITLQLINFHLSPFGPSETLYFWRYLGTKSKLNFFIN